MPGGVVGSQVGQAVESLSKAEKVQRYRQFAEEALTQATHAPNRELHAGFVVMASGWHALASELERDTHGTTSAQPAQTSANLD
ncbi:MAG TPA: hypothetical protein VNW15_16435 [Rhizomicrobium sp.]|nr:hypothetical protein [Rhizomicrobium sp.]